MGLNDKGTLLRNLFGLCALLRRHLHCLLLDNLLRNQVVAHCRRLKFVVHRDFFVFTEHGLLHLLVKDFDFRIAELHHVAFELLGSDLTPLLDLLARDLIHLIEEAQY